MQIFISYARADKELVMPLVDVLRAVGHFVWLDENITPGKHWKRVIFEAIKASDLFLITLSESSVESHWCEWELRQAQALAKPVIPTLLEAHIVPPASLSDIHYLDFTEHTMAAAARLMAAIQVAEQDARNAPVIDLADPIEFGDEVDDEIDDEVGYAFGDTRADGAAGKIQNSDFPPDEQADADDFTGVSSAEHDADDTDYVSDELDEAPAPRVHEYIPLPPIEVPIYLVNTLLGEIISPSPYLHFFANMFDAETINFQDRWKALFAAQIAIFELTYAQRATYLELGIALAMNKPILLLAHHETELPSIINPATLLVYDTLDDLRDQIAELISDEYYAARLAIKGYCHFCDRLHCEAQSRERSADKYLVVSDHTLLRNEQIKNAERHIANQERFALPRNTASLLGDICDLRKIVHESQFVLAHLDDAHKPDTLITLGMAIGHLTPWFIMYDEETAIPPTLRQLELKATAHPAFSLVDELNVFLAMVYPDLIPSDNENLLTRQQTEWEYLENISGTTFHRPTDDLEPILGELVILRHAGTDRETDLYLHPRRHNLVFGRKNEVGVISLESQYASRIHFQVFKRSNRYYVEDLGSKTGTFLNGERIPQQSPVEIGVGDTITAGRSEFLIWDERERPARRDPFVGQTAPLPGIQQVIMIQLDIEPPPDLRRLHNAIMLQAMYSPHATDAQEASLLTQKQCTFSIENYYPLGEVLKVLIPALRLPKMTYHFTLDDQLIMPDDTAATLDLGPLDRLQIVPDSVEWTARLLPDRIFHCQECLAKQNDQPQLWPNRHYITLETLFEAVYEQYYNQSAPPLNHLTVECPRCHNTIHRGMVLSEKQQGDLAY